MKKGPENSSSPIENIGSTIAASLLRQRASAGEDVKNSMVAGNLAEMVVALAQVKEAIRVADTVQRHLDGAVEGIKTDLGYFPSIRVAELTHSSLPEAVEVQYQSFTDSAVTSELTTGDAPQLSVAEPSVPNTAMAQVDLPQEVATAPFVEASIQSSEPTLLEVSDPPPIQAAEVITDTIHAIPAEVAVTPTLVAKETTLIDEVKTFESAGSISPDLVQISHAEKLASADDQLAPTENIDSRAQSGSEATQISELEEITFDQLLKAIAEGQTLPDRIRALRQAVVYLGNDPVDQVSRGKGLTLLEQKVVLAAVDVTPEGKPVYPDRKAIVEQAYVDNVPHKDPRKPDQRRENDRFLKKAQDNVTRLTERTSDKLDKAKSGDTQWEPNLLRFAALLNADVRFSGMSREQLNLFLRGDLTEHNHRMLLLKVEEDVKKKV